MSIIYRPIGPHYVLYPTSLAGRYVLWVYSTPGNGHEVMSGRITKLAQYMRDNPLPLPADTPQYEPVVRRLDTSAPKCACGGPCQRCAGTCKCTTCCHV